ncbi:Protein rad9 [Cytospora mali]|uniref:Sister chromatid cohesion protein n=1 Tax=Cytospora mali TaxID=578113 RepID=A0A194VX24_CYTMA|nr:Protein rad9 [Valsa mali]
MAHPGPLNPNGVQNGVAPSAPPSGPHPRFSRPFTLQEALPYSPFTSVIPFESDIIPTPNLGAGPSSSRLADLVPRHDFDNLNKEAASPSSTSRRLEQSLEHVQNLLSPSGMAQFNFKTGARVATSNAPTTSLAANLSPFSKMVFEKTSVSFRFPTPENPAALSSSGQHVSKTSVSAKPQRPATKPNALPNDQNNSRSIDKAPEKNEPRFAVLIPTKKQYEAAAAVAPSTSSPGAHPPNHQRPPPQPPVVTDPEDRAGISPEVESHSVPGPHTAGTFSIELPPAPAFSKAEYVTVPDEPDEPSNLSIRKRKRDEYGDGQDVYGASRDQKQRADAAFHQLRRCFMEMFDAEENVTATQSDSNPLVFLNSHQEPTMTATAHQKLQPLLQSAISLGCFVHIPVDELLRLQRLSDGALRQVQDIDLKVDEGWGESDAQIWAQQLQNVDTALRAARTVLRIMSAGREDKQIYSEELIQGCLNIFREVTDSIIVPLTEKVRRYGIIKEENKGSKDKKDGSKDLFERLIPHRKTAQTIFTSFTRLYSVLTTLLSSIELSESVVTALETISSNLIFVENASTDRDSVVGVQKFDGIRLVAMDMLSQIFLKNPQSRNGIVDDILLQLEKVPQTKQKARQFKLSDGRSIQPVSALVLRLIQTSAGKATEVKGAQSKLLRSLEGKEEDGGADDRGLTAVRDLSIQDEGQAAIQHGRSVSELQSISSPLADTTRNNAAHVINFMVGRAAKSTKTGESPFRRILENFLEDLITCLDSPDWPASELLLRLLMGTMMNIVDGERTAAPAKNMALEILGSMGAAISKLRSLVRRSANSLDAVEASELGTYLSDLATSALDLRSRPEQLLSWSGPYRANLEYIDQRSSEDPHLSSAVSFLITDWASKVGASYDTFEADDDERDREFGRLAYRLRMMVEDRRWLSTEYSFAEVSPTLAKLSYHIILIRSQFCESYRHILNILLRFMTTDQATVRSKSLKSVNDVLETDPTILDGDSTFIHLILQCSNDSSPQVRDSALGLVGKCIDMRPALEDKMVPTVVDRFIDSGVGVRKRAMKLARDIYLRNPDKGIRSTIANGLLHRVQDPDEGVREVARQMIEEIWISPYYSAEGSATYKTSLADHVALMIQTVKHGNVTPVLDKVFQTILGSKETNFRVGQVLVASMFELVDNPDSERDALQLLMTFAKADPRLFTFEQIKLLQPKVASIASNEDLATSRAVVVIYRRVLPQLSRVYEQFLTDIRNALLPTIAKVTRALLDDVVACLWIISGLLGSTEQLSRLTLSSMQGIQKVRASTKGRPLDEKMMRMFDRYALIVGMVGKHCDLESKLESFKAAFPALKGSTVSKLMVDVVIPFASPSQPLDARKSALDAVGLICQSWPRNYVSANVYTTFQQVFEEQTPELESMILRSLKEFLFTEEKRSELAASEGDVKAETGEKRNLKVMGGTTYDDVSSATTQRFLREITRIALATQDEHAFVAVEVLASINRQGLVHPKETGVTLITLETSSVPKISELAFHEHRALHDKYETVLEREYAKAVQSAFAYQRDIVHDPRGATIEPFTSKLHLMMEVLKSSKAKNRTKFLDKLCAQVDFEPAKLDTLGSMPTHVQFSQFVIENLAFFDYVTVSELLGIVTAMEKLVTGTGASIAQAIEADIFQVTMDMVSHGQAGPDGQDGPVFAPPPPPIDIKRLRQLTAGSMILQSMWEARSYLRRQYNLGTSRRDGKLKAAAKEKESLKPVKIQTITGDKFWEDITSIMGSLSSQERMMEQCRSFVDLLNVDREFKVTEEDDEMNGDEPSTPSGDELDEDADAGRGRKRKSNSTPGSGRKKRARSSSQPRKRGRPRKIANALAPAADEDDDMHYF